MPEHEQLFILMDANGSVPLIDARNRGEGEDSQVRRINVSVPTVSDDIRSTRMVSDSFGEFKYERDRFQ